MRAFRIPAALLVVVLVIGCADGPTMPPSDVAASTEEFNLAARLVGPPDLSGLLPELERRVFIHYRSGSARPEGRSKKPPKEETSQCFSFMANGAGWTDVEPYVTTFALPTDTWDDEAASLGADIFGDGTVVGSVREFDGDLDEVNSAQFGAYPDPNVIAVTVVLGVLRGPPSQRRIVEWDILMNGVRNGGSFVFGDAENSNVMDELGVVTHELGHAAGLGHPPNDCTEETMYAFASAGETKKRTLEAGDIQGIVELYQ